MIFDIVHADALEYLPTLKDNSIDLVLTDPPYFTHGMGADWNQNKLSERKSKGKVINLPVGMKFDPKQGIKFQDFMEKVSHELLRIVKPGGFFISFSQARLYHRLGIAAENAGFEIRDMLGWKYEGQAKAFSMDHFVNKMKLTSKEKEKLIENLEGRKTPQLKPMLEPMVLAQKPKEGTFIENWQKYGTGLIDTMPSLDGKFPGNLMDVKKPSTKEKGKNNHHLTVKPLRLMQHLIQIFSKQGQMILDPFNGSGTTGLACKLENRNYIGIEIDADYVDYTKKRLKFI